MSRDHQERETGNGPCGTLAHGRGMGPVAGADPHQDLPLCTGICPVRRPGVFLMPRRPTEYVCDIPLWLIPQVILQWIRKVGEELEWLQVRRKLRTYIISIRTRPVSRRPGHQRVVPIPAEEL